MNNETNINHGLNCQGINVNIILKLEENEKVYADQTIRFFLLLKNFSL